MIREKIVCPKCELSDRIQKVSALMDSDAPPHTHPTFEGIEVTDMASIKAFPGPPRELLLRPVLWWDKIDIQKWLIVPVGGWFIASFIMFPLIVEPFILGPLHDWRGHASDFEIYIGFPIVLVTFLVSIYIASRILKRVRAKKPYVFNSTKIEQENALLQEKYENHLQAYNNEKEKWSRLYYCHRDDYVFDPGLKGGA